MKPLIVLLAVFGISLLGVKVFNYNFDYAFAGRIGMAAMLLFTAIGHFAYTKGMEMMVPSFVPFKKFMVYLTGVIEIAFAVCLLIPTTQLYTAWSLIAFFVVLLPGNINAAIHNVDYQKGTLDGPGKNYLWFRIPLQVLFIVWVYWCGIMN